jgi:cyclophilin family peptidyl-prolyl cis-trans isomerase
MCIDPKATYRAAIKTSEGVLTVSLNAKRYPNTVNNFVYLSRYRFYDGLTFHRVVPKFIIQGGDPLANGRGSAGYEFADELPDKPGYNIGAVAMANGRPAQPNTNGSQFFIVVGELAKTMTPDFPQFGNVVDGKAVLRKIAALGPDPAVDATGTPSKPVTIESITITVRGEKTP